MNTITKQEIKHWNEQDRGDFILVNVLDHDTFNQQHIRTSVNVPYDHPQFVHMIESISGGKHRDIVLYCASYDCEASAKAARHLESAGFSRVFDYQGGCKDWFQRDKKRAS